MKTHEELEKLAEAVSNVPVGEASGERLMELVGDLTKEDCLALAEIHRRRAKEAMRT